MLRTLALLLTITATAAATAANASPIRIAAFGDSLSAGYNLAERDGFAAALERELRRRGIAAEVVNAAVSGNTSRDGLARLDYLLADPAGFSAAIVEFGANDFRRGWPPAQTRANIGEILTRLRAARVKPLLAGMLAPPSMGAEYAAEFNAVFPSLAAEHGVALYPFFLEGVAFRPELNLADGVHPNARGAAEIARRIAPLVMQIVGEETAAK